MTGKAATTLMVLAVAVATASSAAQQPVFRGGVDLVNFGVFVTDKAGTPLTGLKAEDFEIIEDGARQTVKYFAGGDPEDAPPLHLGFMIDMSGSMADDMKDIRTAAIKFLDTVKHVRDITVVDFDTEVRVARFDGGRSTPGRAPAPPQAGWLHRALRCDRRLSRWRSSQNGDKILVMYTDGEDTRSSMNQGELLDLLKASDVTVYAIGYLDARGQATDERCSRRCTGLPRRPAARPSSRPASRIWTRCTKRSSARSPPATASATCRPTRSTTARGATSRSASCATG